MSRGETGEWYWCMEHGRAEDAGSACAPARRLGPYRTEEDAVHWKDRVDARNSRWEEDDRQWEGQEKD